MNNPINLLSSININFIKFVRNEVNSISFILKDGAGEFFATIYKEGEEYFANCDDMFCRQDIRGEHWPSLSRTVWEFDIWMHMIFLGAEATRTKIKWKALENAYWSYLKRYQPNDLADFKHRYRVACG